MQGWLRLVQDTRNQTALSTSSY